MIFGQSCYLGLSFISQILQIFLKPEIGLIVYVLCILHHSLQNAFVYTAYFVCVHVWGWSTWKSEDNLWELIIPSCRFWGSNPGLRVWQQEPLLLRHLTDFIAFGFQYDIDWEMNQIV